MSKQKDEAFRNVLKYAGTAAAPADFTATVMQEIAADQHEAVIHPALGKLIQQHGVERAPSDFSAMVMSQLKETEQQAKYQPVISKKIGFAIAGVVTLVISGLSLDHEQHAYSAPKDNFYQILASLASIPPIYLLTLFMLCTLLVADYLLRKPQRIIKIKSGIQ